MDKIEKDPVRYLFSRIPNDETGRAFIDQARLYLNSDRFKLRVRGQGLKAGEDWRKHEYGAPLSKSTHLRVYAEDQKQKADINALCYELWEARQKASAIRNQLQSLVEVI